MSRPPDAATSARLRAHALAADPQVPGILRQEVAFASRRCPHLSDEFESHAWFALWTSAIGYRDGMPVPWGTYLAVKLRCRLLEFRRIWHHTTGGRDEARAERRPMCSLAEPAGDSWSATIGDVIPSGDLPVGWELEGEDAAEAILALVKGRRREALRAKYLGCSGGRLDVARRLGVHPTTLDLHHRKAMAAIRKAMGVGKGDVA